MKGIATLASIGASVRLSTNLTVMSSTFSIDLSSSGKPMPAKYSQEVPVTYCARDCPSSTALEREDHVIGIEFTSRREVFGRLELDARTQIERILQAIVGNRPSSRPDQASGSVVPGLNSGRRL